MLLQYRNMTNITSWYNTYTNNSEKTFIVPESINITFSVNTSEMVGYSWFVNKINQNNNTNSLTYTLPNEKGIWEIYLKTVGVTTGEDYLKWVVSTLNLSEAPDIFDYFHDGKLLGRTETDCWKRPLNNWVNGKVSVSGNYTASKLFIEGARSSLDGDDIYLPNKIKYGTWKFNHYNISTSSLGEAHRENGFAILLKNDITTRNNRLNYYAVFDTHRMLMWNNWQGNYIRHDEDSGFLPSFPDKWQNHIIILTPDGWYYDYVNGKLGHVWKFPKMDVPFISVSETLPLNVYVHEPIGNDKGLGISHGGASYGWYAYLDNIEIYDGKYLFPNQNIFYGDFIDYWGPRISEIYYPVKAQGIVVRKTNSNLQEISNYINNPSLFSYNPLTKTAVCKTHLILSDDKGFGELILDNETLLFDCNSDGQLMFGMNQGSKLKLLNNSKIDSTGQYYWKWRINSIGETTGYQLSLLEYFPSWRNFISDAGDISFVSLEIYDSTINNSANFWVSSPLVLKIRNSVISNLHADKHGQWSGDYESHTQTRKQHWDFNKNFVWDENFYPLSDFEINNVKLSISSNSSNSDIIFSQNDELFNKLNIYNLDMPNARIKMLKPIKMWGIWITETFYYNTRTSLVNSRWKDVVFSSDRTEFVPKYYLDVKVVDQNGSPITKANVKVINEINNNDYPAEDISGIKWFVNDNYCNTSPNYCWGALNHNYHNPHNLVLYNYNDGNVKYGELYKMPRNDIIFITDDTGHTKLPNEQNSIVIPHYSQTLTGILYFTYSITAEKDGVSKTIKITPNETLYRFEPLVPTQTIIITLPICPVPMCDFNIEQI